LFGVVELQFGHDLRSYTLRIHGEEFFSFHFVKGRSVVRREEGT